ncbi:MAG: TIGR03084 family metal-binding protein [Pseudomonadota bacterium]
MSDVSNPMPEAASFLAEGAALHAVLATLAANQLTEATQFKSWTFEDIVTHLYLWNEGALLTLTDPPAFQNLVARVMSRLGAGDDHRDLQRTWLAETHPGICGAALVTSWWQSHQQCAERFASADPDLRVNWFGPPMTGRSKIIARQMECWAHGQAIFDHLGLERTDDDRLRPIAHLGVTTYSFAFRNRSLNPPVPKPYVRLTAPSGAVWEWNEAQEDNQVSGPATQFCQIVCQTRAFADTRVQVTGKTASAWMAIAQCFAGPPHPPPAPGSRYRRSTA